MYWSSVQHLKTWTNRHFRLHSTIKHGYDWIWKPFNSTSSSVKTTSFWSLWPFFCVTIQYPSYLYTKKMTLKCWAEFRFKHLTQPLVQAESINHCEMINNQSRSVHREVFNSVTSCYYLLQIKVSSTNIPKQFV